MSFESIFLSTSVPWRKLNNKCGGLSFSFFLPYLKYKGFKVCDTAEPYYELLYLPFEQYDLKPKFKDCCKNSSIEDKGIVLFYTDQCPHTDKYAPLIAEIARKKGQSMTLIKIDSKEQAQNAPSPFTTYSFFYNGRFMTNEIFSESRFMKFLEGIGG